MSAFINRSDYLRKWLILGIAIGIIAGFGSLLTRRLNPSDEDGRVARVAGHRLGHRCDFRGAAGRRGARRLDRLPRGFRLQAARPARQ
jgi:hypothetical protein